MTASIKVPAPAAHRVHPVGGYRARRYPVSDGAPVEVVESGPSIQARLTSLSLRLSFRPVLSVLSHVPHLPWPFGLVDFVARALLPSPGTVRATVGLPNASAQLVRAPGVLPADGTRRVILYMHGGAFLTCGVNSHSRISVALSKFAVLAPEIPNATQLAKIIATPRATLEIGPTTATRNSASGVGGSRSTFDTPPNMWSVMSRTGMR